MPKDSLSVVFFGDVVGKPGRRFLLQHLKELTGSAEPPEIIIANVENAAHGFGLTKVIVDELQEAGVHLFSGGNHTFDRKETLAFIGDYPNVLRPANYPASAPGKGTYIVESKNGFKLGFINLMGRVFMEPLDSPFLMADKLVEELKPSCDAIMVDMHAEATAEKIALGWYLDGRVSCIVGTHTHVQTADERILPAGTAYITDVGLCGPMNGVIGMSRELVLRRFIEQLPTRLEVEEGPAIICGVKIELERKSGKALSIERIYIPEKSE